MTAPGQHSPYDQHLEVETPENVVLDYEIAGMGSRLHAAFIDMVWYVLIVIALLVVGAFLSGLGLPISGAMDVLLIIVGGLGFWAYFTFFEALREGQTPGKRTAGIRVVRDTGHPVTLAAAAARGLLRAVDLFPPVMALDVLLMVLHPRARRLGDLVAGTIVVRDRPVEAPLPEPVAVADDDSTPPELDDAEFRILREFIERAPSLTPELRDRFATRLEERFVERFPVRAGSPYAVVSRIYQTELSRRRSRFASTRRGGGGIAEKFVARKTGRWGEFRALADRAARKGLDSLEAAELPDFAARYREVAADLARARTYHAPPSVRHQLERLVAAGHNALYRDDRKTGARIWEIVMRECPAAVLQAWRYVLIGIICFATPSVAGYVLLRDRPELAQEVLPEGMLRRAEAGAERIAQGQGYYESNPGRQPIEATYIISNNIRVAFMCFAGGALLGIGALFLLAYNGLSIGATFGHFANVGLFGYIGTFVAGHGTLELFAICVAGAAGLLLGRSMIAPGQVTRSEALVVNGRIAVRMIGAVVFMLAVAGTIEGFVSTGTGGLGYRFGLAAASLLVLFLYLLNGAWYLRRS
jgi:uncharacterized membrane protein SpoIIM required for sporulation/uncharacterized RDD family membrane protein YckC